MTAIIKTSARVGRERTCNQCGGTYRSPRNSSRFCSPACRKKANRGTPPTGGPKAGRLGWSIITRALQLVGYVGRIGPFTNRSDSPANYALLVDSEAAYTELAYQFERRGWGCVTRAEFDAALRADGILGFNTRSPEAAQKKRWKDRQRQRMNRTA